MSVDYEKNRYYLRILGFWQKTSEVPDYLVDTKEITESLSPGFTCLDDNREAKTPTPEIMEKIHPVALRIMNKAGLEKIAMVFDKEIIKIAGTRVAREGSMEEQTRQFDDIKKAEEWLDGKDV